MAEETNAAPKTEQKKTAPPSKKGGGKWFKKIPTEVILSPGGIVLILLAFVIEVIDWIPLPGLDSLTWEMVLEVIFCVFLAAIAKIPIQSMILPFVIERIPLISDILPTWLIRMFI